MEFITKLEEYIIELTGSQLGISKFEIKNTWIKIQISDTASKVIRCNVLIQILEVIL